MPERKKQMTWKSFIQFHWYVLAAIDFTTIEVWTKSGLTTFYQLFVMELSTKRVHFAGHTANPEDNWMMQVCRNLTDFEDGFLRDKNYILMDRDQKYSESFRTLLKESGTMPVRLPAKSPNLNAHIERFMRSLKEECLERMILFGEESLRTASVRVSCSLSFGAEPSRFVQSTNSAIRRTGKFRKRDFLSESIGRNASILLPESCLIY